MSKYSQQIAKEFRRRRNNLRYFYFRKKVQSKKEGPIATPQETPISLPNPERVLENLSGKLASVREIERNIDSIKKPTKQMLAFKSWLQDYEAQLLDEWNRANDR